MATDAFKLTIHMVCSLDGYIAKKDNSVSWFDTADHYEKGTTGEDAAAFLSTISCYVMGSHTYEHALELSKSHGWVYGDKPCIVLTTRNLPVDRPNIETYSGNLHKLVHEKLKTRYTNVWVVGGAILTRDFIRQNLANEIRQSIIPIILGEGKPFFDRIEQEKALHLVNTTAYKNGIVELCYEIKK